MLKLCPKCKDSDSPATKFQNEKYGYGIRVHNIRKDRTLIRCTVCGNEKSK